jgi:tRNA dimethylallyltransferase
VFITGPTASGKTQLSIQIAQQNKNKFVVINADALQLYENADIFTATPSETEQQGV